ncbi:helix-turn-helix transcriptional regulator [Hydrogenophaga atypica]|uniref:Helix-turn-helix transcriptional regulator n=1 Tax=Hydrogenophaga atypica TaxID=249409 RepID=A0ABW2QNB0_9BURK
MKDQTQERLAKISAIATLALHALETPAGRRDIQALSGALRAIKDQAEVSVGAVRGSESATVGAEVESELGMLREAVMELVRLIGPRLTREQVCLRLGVARSTLAKRLEMGQYPRPGKDGKWLLSEILEWERRR